MFINCFTVMKGSKDRCRMKESMIHQFIEPERSASYSNL